MTGALGKLEVRILRDFVLIITGVIILAMMQTSVARIPHIGVSFSAPPPSVVLGSPINTFGNKTLAARGGERLSRMDQTSPTYSTKFHPYGTGILISGSCARWSTSVQSGNPAYWNVISHVDEGPTAITPTLTAAGVTAQAGGAGTTTTFLVSCEDAFNNVIATTTFAYAINDGDNHCGAVNIGDQDNTGSTYFPSGFGTSIDGCYVQMSTGYVKTGRFFIGMPFAKKVYLTQADPSRPGELQNIETGSNSTNAVMRNIMVLPAKTNGVGSAAFSLSGTNISAENIHAFSTQAQRTVGSYQCLLTNSTNTVQQHVTNFGCEWVAGFFSPKSNYDYQYGWSRYNNGDAIITSGFVHDFTIKDIIIAAFHTPAAPGIHPDTFQQGDGAVLWNYEVDRIMVIPGDGDMGSQGPYFGGGPSGSGNSWKGFLANTNCDVGSVGQTLCNVNGGAQTTANGTKIYSPTNGSPIGLTDGVTVNCGGTPCPFNLPFTANGSGTTLNVTAFNPNDNRTIAIGSMITGTGIPWQTTIVSQSSGTAGRIGTYVVSNSITTPSSTVQTVTKYTLSGLPGDISYGSDTSPATFYGIVGLNSVWNGIWHAGQYIQGTFPVGSAGTSSIQHFTHNYAVISADNIGAPRLSYTNCDWAPLWTGTLTVQYGAEYNVVTNSNPAQCGGASGVPGNVTQTNVLQAANNTSTLATWYVNSNVKTCIEGLTTPAAAMNMQQMAVAYATCTIPKVAGPLDLGSGQYAGAQTTAATPTWFDGTLFGQGFDGW